MITIYKLVSSYRKRQYFSEFPADITICTPNYVISLKDKWHSRRIKLEGMKYPLLDNVSCGCDCTPVFSQRVLDTLGNMISPFGEFLPIDCPNASMNLYYFNVTNGIYGMDIDKTQYGYIREYQDGDIHRHDVTLYVFRPDVIRDEVIFKDLSTIKSSIYVTDRFVQAVIDANLTGFIFRRVWSEEQGHIAIEKLPLYQSDY